MRRKSTTSLLVLAICFLPALAIGQDTSVQELVKLMPPGANAVMLAHIDGIRESDIAKKENWFGNPFGGIQSGVLFLPHGADGVVYAAQMDFQTILPTWTSGAIRMDNPPALTAISQKLNGSMDNVAGRDIVATGSDTFVFKLDNKTLGTYIPAKRQELADWIAQLKGETKATPPQYLVGAIASAVAGTDLVIATDLTNVVSSMGVLERAKDSELLKSRKIDPKEFSDLVGSVQGVTVNINIGQAIRAAVNIDFADDATILQPVAKTLIMEFVNNHGTGIDGLDNWQASVSGKQVRFSGELDKKGLRRLISLFETPEPHMTAPSTTAAPPAADQPSAMAIATKDYFEAVSSLIKELQKDVGVGGQNSWKIQRWMGSFGEKIDNLPIKNVDNQTLDFGASVSQFLQNVSQRVTVTRNSAKVQDSNIMAYGAGSPTNRSRRYGYGYNGYGYGYAYPWSYNAENAQAQADKLNVRVKGRAEAADYAVTGFDDMVTKEREMRRMLTEKYPSVFER